jgi:hypothetical protein
MPSKASLERRRRWLGGVDFVKVSANESTYAESGHLLKCPACKMPMSGTAESHLFSCSLRACQEANESVLVAAAYRRAEAEALSIFGDSMAMDRFSDILHRLTPTSVLRELAIREVEATIKEAERDLEHVDVYEGSCGVHMPSHCDRCVRITALQQRLKELKAGD